MAAAFHLFWNHDFWLPENVTWNDFQNTGDGIYHPQATDILMSLPIAIIVYVIRQICERFLFSPIGRFYGLKNTVSRWVVPNKILEEHYKLSKQPVDGVCQGLAKQTDMSVRRVQRWYRVRRNQDRTGVLKKFTETFWRFTIYLVLFFYGVAILWNKIWLWDTTECWKAYPHQHVTADVYWYYMVELGFYLSLLVSQFSDVKRKDFLEMFIHHVATIVLLTLSWVGGMVRIGTLILCVHDAVDYWVESAKLAKYVKKQRLCDFLFVMFGLVWFGTRLVLYPLIVLNSSIFECMAFVGAYPLYYVSNSLLCILQVLHVLWFMLIVRVAYQAIRHGEIVDDVRSQNDESVSEDELSTIGKLANHKAA